MKSKVSLGLYRHFKGEFYYVSSIARDTTSEYGDVVFYFNVLHPEYGTFTRPIEDFCATVEEDGTEIHDRLDNKTGQYARFEKVVSLTETVKNLSTQTLIEELRNRSDSPLNDLDIEGFNNQVFCKDYVYGIKESETEDHPKGVSNMLSFFNEKAVKSYFENHHNPRAGVFKRIFIEIQ